MNTTEDKNCCEKTTKTGEVRMGREVAGKETSCADTEKDAQCAENKKKEASRENAASSLV